MAQSYDDTTRRLITTMQAGGELNGLKNADYGPYSDVIQEVMRAYESGGTRAAMAAIEPFPDLLRLAAGGDGGRVMFPSYTLTEGLQLPEPEYLIYGLMTANEIGMMFGSSSAGKTYVAIDMAVSMAAGVKWMGRYDIKRPCKVVYFAGEGGRGIYKRILAAVNGLGARGHNVTKIRELVNQNLVIVPAMPQLFSKDDPRAAKVYLAEWQAAGRPDVDMIILDTLHRAALGAEENSSADAGVLIDSISMIQREIGCAALFVHHSNKGGGYRGSTALRANVDYSIKVEGKHREPRTITIDKIRDGEEDGPIPGADYIAKFTADHASGSTFISWLNDSDAAQWLPKKDSQKERAKIEIKSVLESRGPLSKSALTREIKSVTKNTANSYINEMIRAGELTESPGPKNSKIIALFEGEKTL